MKSITLIRLAISLIMITAICTVQISVKSKDAPYPSIPITVANAVPRTLAGPKGTDMTSIFATLFRDPSRTLNPPRKVQTEVKALVEDLGSFAIPHKKENYYEKRQLGWGPSAYLFDFIDDVLQRPITDEFDRIFLAAKQIVGKTVDPYTLENILGGRLSGITKPELIKKIKALQPKFNEIVWENSITVPQIHQIVKEWNWFFDATKPDFAKNIVDLFDFNGDGRLNAREFTIAMIKNNKGSITALKPCKNCMENISVNKIDLLYQYSDIRNTGFVHAADLFDSFKNLIRNPIAKLKYNIYGCVLQNGSYRTSAFNDLILKGGRMGDGKINLEQFRQAILTGYWDRQTDESTIYHDDTKNMKNVRWSGEGAVDIVCSRILAAKAN